MILRLIALVLAWCRIYIPSVTLSSFFIWVAVHDYTIRDFAQVSVAIFVTMLYIWTAAD